MQAMDFMDHSRQLGNFRFVYAVISRRSQGLSIGINVNPDKVCNFACPYCQVDRRTPGADKVVDIDVLRHELDTLLTLVSSGDLWNISPYNTADKHLQRVNDIAIAGDGEPTSCPNLRDVLSVVIDARARHGLDAVKLFVLTNATLLHRPTVQSALDEWDAAGGGIWAKLDAGSQERYDLVNVAALSFSKIRENLALATRRWRVIIQSMQMSWEDVPPTAKDVGEWASVVESLLADGGTIEQVQIYTIARAPMDSRCGALSIEQLTGFAHKIAHLDIPIMLAGGSTVSLYTE